MEQLDAARDDLMKSLTMCTVDKGISILNDEVLGGSVFEKMRKQLIMLMIFRPGFRANLSQLHQQMIYIRNYLVSATQNIAVHNCSVDTDKLYVQNYDTIHKDPKGSLNFTCFVSNSFFQSDSEIIEEAQTVLIKNRNSIIDLKENSIYAIHKALNGFDDLNKEISSECDKVFTKIIHRNPTYEGLKLYLQELCDKGMFEVFADIVVYELPQMALSLTKDEWDMLVGWTFTNQTIVNWACQTTNTWLHLPISRQDSDRSSACCRAADVPSHGTRDDFHSEFS